MNTYPGFRPAVVRTYDAASRTARVEIPGITDGAEKLPEAAIAYPLGDKSKDGPHATEIEIVAGDPVWVFFENGDPRFPVIAFYRNPSVGNAVGTRRYHHENMDLLADTAMKLISNGTIQMEADGAMTLKATTLNLEATTVNIKGNTAISGGTLTHAPAGGAAKNIGGTHTHPVSGSTTDVPNA
jgi:hypothetical protein